MKMYGIVILGRRQHNKRVGMMAVGVKRIYCLDSFAMKYDDVIEVVASKNGSYK
jgi:predicted ThiF/HesA family dinucleotide-utilizing enzyme